MADRTGGRGEPSQRTNVGEPNPGTPLVTRRTGPIWVVDDPVKHFNARVSASRILRGLVLMTLALVALSTLGQILKYGFGHESVFGLVPKFWLDREGNFPTLFSGFLLLLVSALALANGETLRRRRAPWSTHWRAIAVVFFVMALDETVGIHERITDEFRRVVELDGIFRFQWVVVGIAFCVVASALSSRFVIALPRRIRNHVLLAGAVYFAGAVGMEMVGGKLFELYGGLNNIPYVISATIEETLEMVGLLLFIRVFMEHLVRELDVKSFTVSFNKE